MSENFNIVIPKRKRRTYPKEIAEQIALARFLDRYEPTRGYWFHPPNGGWRGKKTAQWLLKSGAKAGVPDVMICKPCVYLGEWYVGTALELKRQNATDSNLSARQRHWLHALAKAGWLTTWTRGKREAVELIESAYPEHTPTPPPRSPFRARSRVAQDMLLNEHTTNMSNRAIGRHAGISGVIVGRMREDLTAAGELPLSTESLAIDKVEAALMRLISGGITAAAPEVDYDPENGKTEDPLTGYDDEW